MPVSTWMWASATVERFSATAFRASPVSTEEMVHTTFRSTSRSSSSRSTVARSIRSSSSSKPASRRAWASSTVPTAKRLIPSSRIRRASSVRPAPPPSPVSTPYSAAPLARSLMTAMLARTAAFSMISLRMVDGSLLSVSGVRPQLLNITFYHASGKKATRRGRHGRGKGEKTGRFTKSFQNPPTPGAEVAAG